MDKKLLENKLEEINSIIDIQYQKENHVGVLAGLSGIALFKFYYANYTNNETYLIDGGDIITHSIEMINKGYNFSTHCSGIAGLGWTMDHLEIVEFIDISTDEVLRNFDGYLLQLMRRDLHANEYDFLHNAIGYAYYFLNRLENTSSEELKGNYQSFLLEFIDFLKNMAVVDNENTALKWISEINKFETPQQVYNLSLSHGMSSIVGILIKLHKHQVFRDQVEVLLRKTLNYIASFMNKNITETTSYFPNWVSLEGKVDYNTRLAWCYGDLGVGLQFWHASKILKEEHFKNIALKTLEHASKKRDPVVTRVVDASICHGSFGLAQIFNRMYKETKANHFKKAADFWINDGMDKATHKDGYAGYKQYYGHQEKWSPNLSLLEGVAGIGLVILDYLSDEKTTWDECLMIS